MVRFIQPGVESAVEELFDLGYCFLDRDFHPVGLSQVRDKKYIILLHPP